MDTVSSDLRANRLLALLDDPTLRAVAPHLERVPLALRDTLYEEMQPMPHAWFPVDAVLSVLGATSAAGTPIEVATIGSEGVLGVPLFLGADRSPGLVFCQVEGSAWRLRADAYRELLQAHPSFAEVLRRYTFAYIVQISQGVACNRAHGIEQRCARWLLQTHDRVRRDAFDLTQEFLAQMLGERRAAVNQAASTLQQHGLIRYSRGRIEVTNRAGLEGAACGCYRYVRDAYDRALSECGSPAKVSPAPAGSAR